MRGYSSIDLLEPREVLCAPVLLRGHVLALVQLVSGPNRLHSHRDLCLPLHPTLPRRIDTSQDDDGGDAPV